ncbi:NAD-glutamate dehydrogenase domain-containing protein [Desulfuromonas acetoxidans]|uniref:NAD-glutamate dehydrogenase domain-containing protein n=1 Tax=Desulfuromonas acetoxidans TaxID=891 RepID=UPI002930FFDA|nr:NAD-glutamate dehydrogenase domain-containing protein [Desulfuromonas acetoxidans]
MDQSHQFQTHSKTIAQFHELLATLTDSLKQRFDDPQRAAVFSLLKALKGQAVPGELLQLSSDEMVEIISSFFATMDARQQPVAVRCIPVTGHHISLLLCSVEDAQYLFDSLQVYLTRQHLDWQEIVHLRLKVEREDGHIVTLADADLSNADESFIVVQLAQVEGCEQLEQDVADVFHEVHRFRNDTPALQQRFTELEGLAGAAGFSDLWQWLKDDHFLLLGYRQLQLDACCDDGQVQALKEKALGISDHPDHPNYLQPQALSQCDDLIQSCLMRKSPLLVMQTVIPSQIWRDEPLTAICLRDKYNEYGILEHVLLGLYTRSVHGCSALDVPALQSKITYALEHLGIAEGSYNYRKIEALLATFPEPELFFLSVEQLKHIINSLLFAPQGSVRVVPMDTELSTMALLLIVPRTLSQNADFSQLENFLSYHFHARKPNMRVLQFNNEYYIVQATLICRDKPKDVDFDQLASSLTGLLQSWKQKLRTVLIREQGNQRGLELWRRYSDAFCPDYRSRIHPRFCLRDIHCLETLLKEQQEQVDLWGPINSGVNSSCRLQFYSTRQGYLNELMPILVNLDLTIIDEVDFTLNVDGQDLFIKSFGVLNKLPGQESLLHIRERLLDALRALRSGRAENDYLNRLLVSTGLDWQQIDVFRAYRNYYFQLGSSFTKRTVAFALLNNPRASLALYRYFESRFINKVEWADPVVRDEQALFPARMELIEALREVDDVNEDRILRTIFNLIDSTVRTNFFKRKDSDDYFFSFKISAIGITDMPVPRPLFEVYVHNAAMEGIHLRGGMVARGGIRWSDRPDDFRTEILGLMKTQMTKNAQIVPVGSKGGFIVKTPWSDREEGMALSKKAYQTLMRGLLDVTDNRVGGKVVPSQDVVRYDEDDPYLVVAADKGTAHLPDTANAVSRDYNFWLGDGFASGGSRGYDHKVLGITARGAWVCVQRHFREMGIDIQSEPFSVVGIGDMSGDVFGNGMLLSEQICLKAAFNHRHIFLDPDPDPATTFTERKRLFELPRSSWSDFNPELISEGGGVFDRDAKEIPLSEQVRDWLGVRHETLDGDSLIRLLLMADVDLLWNGGIGTYVKAGSEKDEDAGDRANDAVRINGSQLRAKVVGEGGNLGMTQLARIEYAVNGGRINTDAIDNSAGVDCSDHEVNLKIFMQHLMESGQVADEDERDRLLEAVTDDVCDVVLANNYGQSQCLSLDSLRSQQDRELFIDLTARLATIDLLNRQSEALPGSKEVMGRKVAYTRPELAILLAYSKMQLYHDLLESDLPDRPLAAEFLADYYPQAIADQFADHLDSQPLKREIIATMITNLVVNQAGCAFCYRMGRRYDIPLHQVAEAYIHFDRLVDGAALRGQIQQLDNQMPTKEQYRRLLALEETLSAMCDWALSQARELIDFEQLSAMSQDLANYGKLLSSVLPEKRWNACQQLAGDMVAQGMDEEHALQFATLPMMENLLPVMALHQQTEIDLHTAAVVLGDVQSQFEIKDLLSAIEQVPLRDRWDRMTRHALRTGYHHAEFVLAKKVLQQFDGNIDRLLAQSRVRFRRYKRLQTLMLDQPAANFHPLMIMLDHLNGML